MHKYYFFSPYMSIWVNVKSLFWLVGDVLCLTFVFHNPHYTHLYHVSVLYTNVCCSLFCLSKCIVCFVHLAAIHICQLLNAYAVGNYPLRDLSSTLWCLVMLQQLKLVFTSHYNTQPVSHCLFCCLTTVFIILFSRRHADIDHNLSIHIYLLLHCTCLFLSDKCL